MCEKWEVFWGFVPFSINHFSQSLHNLLSAIYHQIRQRYLTKLSNASFFLSLEKIVSRLVFTKGTYTGEEEWVYKKKTFFLFYIYVNIPPLLNCRWFFFFILFCFLVYLACISNFFSFASSLAHKRVCVYAGYALYSLFFGWLLTFFIIYWTL